MWQEEIGYNRSWSDFANLLSRYVEKRVSEIKTKITPRRTDGTDQAEGVEEARLLEEGLLFTPTSPATPVCDDLVGEIRRS